MERSEKWKVVRVFLAVGISVLLIGCKIEKKPQEPSAEETAVDALPENVGDKNTPTAIKALRGAEEAKKKIDGQRKEDAKVLQEAN